MPKRSSSRDINETAFAVVQQATGKVSPANVAATVAATINIADAAGSTIPTELQREVMREMGRRGGLKGGKARAAKLSIYRRKEIARAGAKARWSKKPTC